MRTSAQLGVEEGSAGALVSYVFESDVTKEILRCRLSGRVTDEVFKDFIRAGSQYALRMHPSAGIVDLSEVTSFDVSARTIEDLAKQPSAVPGRELRRIVIAPSAETFGMMRMFEIEAEEQRPDIHVVHSEREAWAILAVQNPKFEPLGSE